MVMIKCEGRCCLANSISCAIATADDDDAVEVAIAKSVTPSFD
jgi:hypothetical protein